MIFTSDRQEAKRLAAQIRGSYSAGPNEHGMFEVFDGDTIEHAMREALDRAQGAEAREEGLRDALAERITRIVALELERDSALARVEALEAALRKCLEEVEAVERRDQHPTLAGDLARAAIANVEEGR